MVKENVSKGRYGARCQQTTISPLGSWENKVILPKGSLLNKSSSVAFCHIAWLCFQPFYIWRIPAFCLQTKVDLILPASLAAKDEHWLHNIGTVGIGAPVNIHVLKRWRNLLSSCWRGRPWCWGGGITNLGCHLDTPRKAEAQPKNCLHQICLWACLWNIFLIINWCKRAHPIV